jgi:AraC-like DNA-binding protein
MKTVIKSPGVFLASHYDKVVFIDCDKLAAKSFCFHPTFINKTLNFDRLLENKLDNIADKHDRSLLSLFFLRDDFFNGIINILPQAFLRILELFDFISREIEAKYGEYRLYNIRRCLIQILFLLQDAYKNQKESYALSDISMINTVLEFMHANYTSKISIDAICGLLYINRTTLTRKFKALTGKSPIDYLLHFKLGIACELLTHSKLSVSKIAEASGFNYETYFIRLFKSKIGVTPHEYRQSEGFETINIHETRIIEEF